MRSLTCLVGVLAMGILACGDDSAPGGSSEGGGGGTPTDGGAGAVGPGGAGGAGAAGAGGSGGEGGEGGEGGGCVPFEETCDGTDEDCDGVADDGSCSQPSLAEQLFVSGAGVDHVRGVAIDLDGNIYLTGALSPSADIGGGPAESAQGYIASFAPDGTYRWSYLFGAGAIYNYGQDVAVSDSLVCAAGAFVGPFDFGGGVRASSGYNDAVVVCLDPTDGSYLWDRSFGADLSDTAQGVAITETDEVVVTGSFGNGANFGGGPVTGAGNNDAFVARYGSAGAYQWARTYAGAGSESGAQVAVDSEGNAFVVGAITSPIDFGGGVRTPVELYVPFVLSLDPSGGYRWDIAQTEGAVINLYGVEVQSTGDVVIAGEYNGILALGGEPIDGGVSKELQLFAAGFSGDGEALWKYAATGEAGSRGFALAVGSDDSIVVAGSFTGTETFGDLARTSAGAADLVGIGLTPSGSYLWDVTYGGSDDDEVYSAAVAPNGRVALAGGSWGDVDLGLGEHTNAGELDGLVLLLDPPQN